MSNNVIEIELRYEILDPVEIKNFLAQAQLLHTKHDVDVYLDKPDRILWRRGIFVRIRNDKKLDIKFNRACLHDQTIERLDYCEEHSFTLPLEDSLLPTLNNVLKDIDLQIIPRADLVVLKDVNQLDAHYIVDKVRASYTYDLFTIAIDEVKDLGTFLEIELMAEKSDDLEEVKNRMRLALAGLKLKPLRLGYCSQVVKKQNFECYRRGRYVLPEDRI
jgi:adenylate cyclase class IV